MSSTTAIETLSSTRRASKTSISTRHNTVAGLTRLPLSDRVAVRPVSLSTDPVLSIQPAPSVLLNEPNDPSSDLMPRSRPRRFVSTVN